MNTTDPSSTPSQPAPGLPPSYLETGDRRGRGMAPPADRPPLPTPPPTKTPPPAPPPLTLRDLRWVLILALILQLVALGQLEGYRLADSVEYLDRAEQVAGGGSLDPGTVRSFAFSALLMPLFWLAQLFGLNDLGPVVVGARLMQMALALLAVGMTGRLASRHLGRAAGYGAACLLAFNPILLQYSVEPLSGTAAMFCLVMALDPLLRPTGFRRGLTGGLWLGLGFLMAFKLLMPIGILFALLLLRDRWKRPGFTLGVLAGIGVFTLIQCWMDQIVYGIFGSSVVPYIRSNLSSILATFCYKLGWFQAAEWVAVNIGVAIPLEGPVGTIEMTSKTSSDWYLVHLTSQAFVWPALALVALGLLRGLRRLCWIHVLCSVTVVASVVLMSTKGDKSFRLWLPILPLIAVLGGSGWSLLAGQLGAPGRGPRLRRAGAWALLAAIGLGGLHLLRQTNLRQYGGYWQAIQLVDDTVAEEASPPADGALPAPRPRIASAYDWAVKYRDSVDVERIKLPAPIDRWPVLGEPERTAILDELRTLDWFIAHEQAIVQDPRITQVVNWHFEIIELFYDHRFYEELQPIYVLRKRRGDVRETGARSFFEVFVGQDPGAYQAKIQHPSSVDFRQRDRDGNWIQVVFLGWDVETGLAGGELALLTYHWYAGPLGDHDLTFNMRVTDSRRWRLSMVSSPPAHGAIHTTEMKEGWILRETHLLKLVHYKGGPWNRGDLIPASVFVEVAEYDTSVDPPAMRGRLQPHHPAGESPIHKAPGLHHGFVSDHGRRWSLDGLLQVGGFMLPVPDFLSVPDDGRAMDARR